MAIGTSETLARPRSGESGRESIERKGEMKAEIERDLGSKPWPLVFERRRKKEEGL